MPYMVDSYPNVYRAGPAYELYGDPDAYLKWRGPVREAARLRVLEIIAPVYGEALAEVGLNLDMALNKSIMFNLAFGSGAPGSHRIFGHNLLDLAEVFEASLNVTAMHESIDYAMTEKMNQFIQKAHEVVAAGLNVLANLSDLDIPDNVAPQTPIEPAPETKKSNWFVPLGLIVTAFSILG